MSADRDTLLHDTATLYSRAARLLDPVRLQVWESLGLGFPQLRILMRVLAHPGIDVRGLATALGISPSAVSQQVDRLVAKDFLERNDDPEDRRHVRLQLTELGRQAAGEISRATRAQVEQVLVSLTEAELAELHRLLERVLSASEAVNPPSVALPQPTVPPTSVR